MYGVCRNVIYDGPNLANQKRQWLGSIMGELIDLDKCV